MRNEDRLYDIIKELHRMDDGTRTQIKIAINALNDELHDRLSLPQPDAPKQTKDQSGNRRFLYAGNYRIDTLGFPRHLNKIQAIKLIRVITGLGLKQAKDFIEHYELYESNAVGLRPEVLFDYVRRMEMEGNTSINKTMSEIRLDIMGPYA